MSAEARRAIAAEVRQRITPRAYAFQNGAKGNRSDDAISCILCDRPKKRRFQLYPGWRWHAHCCQKGGDVIALYAAHKGTTYQEAVTELARDVGVDIGGLETLSAQERADRAAAAEARRREIEEEERREAELDRAKAVARALSAWRAAEPLGDDLAALYLRGRGIDPAALRFIGRDGAMRRGWPPSLRFHPGLAHPDAPREDRASWTFPALLGLIQAPDGRPIGLHRTFLKPDGSAKTDRLPRADSSAKAMLGDARGGSVRLSFGPSCATLGRRRFESALLVAEGIEDALSVLMAAPYAPVWAALSRGSICGAAKPGARGPRHAIQNIKNQIRYAEAQRPDPDRPGVALLSPARTAIVVRDRDDDRTDSDAVYERLRRAGRSTRRAAGPLSLLAADGPDGSDPNSLLQSGGVAALAGVLADARPLPARAGP
ncbi:MAG: hypothetical protein AAF360_10170 [Pseudomonadota bacterium]